MLGGTFNPIHEGHLQMARAVKECGIERVIILPDGDPPHKKEGLAGKDERLKMARLAAGNEFEVSDIEINRKGTTYTVDTLEELHAEHPEWNLWMIIGGDTLHEITGWKNASRVFELCGFLVFMRNGTQKLSISGAKIRFLDTKIIDISSTQVRERVRQGKTIAGFVPQSVEYYIGFNRLYQPPSIPCREKMLEMLKSSMKPSRFFHTLGVEKTMVELSERFRVSKEQASLCGLLHDCAKGFSLTQMREMIAYSGIDVPTYKWESEALLHGIAGAVRARKDYGVTDPEVLHAITVHTTGCVQMSELDKLLYLSDMIEPGRQPFEGLDEIRTLVYQLGEASLPEVMRRKLIYLHQCGSYIDPETENALKALQ